MYSSPDLLRHACFELKLPHHLIMTKHADHSRRKFFSIVGVLQAWFRLTSTAYSYDENVLDSPGLYPASELMPSTCGADQKGKLVQRNEERASPERGAMQLLQREDVERAKWNKEDISVGPEETEFCDSSQMPIGQELHSPDSSADNADGCQHNQALMDVRPLSIKKCHNSKNAKTEKLSERHDGSHQHARMRCHSGEEFSGGKKSEGKHQAGDPHSSYAKSAMQINAACGCQSGLAKKHNKPRGKDHTVNVDQGTR